MKLQKTSFTYTPYFCEENIWKLLKSFQSIPQIKPLHVLFVINTNNTVVIYSQNNADILHPVVWDYHVILSAEVEHKKVIFDFDSRCPFPDDIHHYFTYSFPAIELIEEKYAAKLRLVTPDSYLEHFTSDRKHMLGIIPETEFPNYKSICAEDVNKALTLDTYINATKNIDGTKLMTPKEYLDLIE